jgi:hypothetical protein
MKRWATHLFIVSYLGVLAFGLAAHALTFLKGSHPAMYFIVWDMFCGWSTYENRYHILGEGDSGQHYVLAPGPWGGLIPFGSAQRHDYDVYGNYGYRFASNVLAHTDHEPIRRILVVEEAWPKKYNLAPDLWERRYQSSKPAAPYSYFHVRRIFNSAGESVLSGRGLLQAQSETLVLDNPRLRAEIHRGQTFYATNPRDQQALGFDIQPVGFQLPSP